eukprot:scaffold505027_cov185-Attheya_sp.AAC.1
MAAPASGHWTFRIIVGYGLGLGVGLSLLLIINGMGLKIAAIKTTAPTKAHIALTTLTVEGVP